MTCSFRTLELFGGHEGHRGFALGFVMLLMNPDKDLLVLIVTYFYHLKDASTLPCEDDFFFLFFFLLHRKITNNFSVPRLMSAAPRAVYASVTPIESQLAKREKLVNKNSTTLYLPFKKKMPIFICFEEDKHTSDN